MAQVIDIGAVSDGPALTLNKSEPESPKPIEVSVDKPSVNKPSVNFGWNRVFDERQAQNG